MTETFDPSSVPESERITFHVAENYDDRYFALRFITFIIHIRIMASKLKSGFKFIYGIAMLGNHNDYVSPFLIVTLINDNASIDVLIYKPELYILAIRASSHWCVVEDFTNHTNMEFKDGENRVLSYSFTANYDKCPMSINRDDFVGAISVLSRGRDDDNTQKHFEYLCVVMAESARFDRFLYGFSTAFGERRAFNLTSKDRDLTRAWGTVFKVWQLYVDGYGFDPLSSISHEAQREGGPQRGEADSSGGKRVAVDLGIYKIEECFNELKLWKPIELSKEEKLLKGLQCGERKEGRNFWLLGVLGVL